MRIRAYWQFYKDCFVFILASAVILFGLFGLGWGMLGFCSISVFLGFLGFSFLKSEEFYFYYNLGIRRWELIKATLIINLVVAVPVGLVFTFISFLFGDIRIT